MEQKQKFNPQQTQTKKPVPIVGKAILIYIASVVLGLVLSSPLGKLYRYIEGPYTSTTVGVLFDEGVDRFLGGLIYGYCFFLGLLIVLFIPKFKHQIIVWIIGVSYFVLTTVLTNDWMFFIYLIPPSLLGFLLGKLILAIHKKTKKK